MMFQMKWKSIIECGIEKKIIEENKYFVDIFLSLNFIYFYVK